MNKSENWPPHGYQIFFVDWSTKLKHTLYMTTLLLPMFYHALTHLIAVNIYYIDGGVTDYDCYDYRVLKSVTSLNYINMRVEQMLTSALQFNSFFFLYLGQICDYIK